MSISKFFRIRGAEFNIFLVIIATTKPVSLNLFQSILSKLCLVDWINSLSGFLLINGNLCMIDHLNLGIYLFIVY